MALTDLHMSKVGVAALATTIVETLNDGDPTFKERFLKNLTETYYKLRDDTEGDTVQALELLSWTREFLTGFSQFTGQGEPLLPR